MILRYLIVACLTLSSFIPAYGMEQEEELYSSEKQPYNPVYFRQRTLEISKALAEGFTQVPFEKEIKRYRIHIPNTDPVTYPLVQINEENSAGSIRYLTQKGLEEHQVIAISSRIYRQDGSPYTTSEAAAEGDIIVMDELGNMFIHYNQKGVFQYSSFFSGRPLAFAGFCEVRNARLKEIRICATDDYIVEALKIIMTALDDGHLKCSMYNVIEKKRKLFYVVSGGHASTFSAFEDLGCLYVTKRTNVNAALRKIDLATGALLASYPLPSHPSGMIKTQDHVTVLGIEKDQLPKQSWVHSFHKSYGNVCKMSFPHNFTAIEPLGVLKGNTVAAFIGDDYESVMSINPEEGTIKTQSIEGSGRLEAIGGAFMLIENDDLQSKKGKITLWEDSEAKISLETVKFPCVKSIERQIFYKLDETHLIGYDLENKTPFFQASIPSNSFSKNSLITDVKGQTWLFDITNHALQAYTINNLLLNSLLSLQWSCKNPLHNPTSIKFVVGMWHRANLSIARL